MVKEEKSKVDGDANPKGWRFQQSTSSRKDTCKASTCEIEDKVLQFGKQRHFAEFVKKCEETSKAITVNYKHGGP